MTLPVRDQGEGEPVLLLHGFPDSGDLWRHQVGPLAEAGFRTIVPDLPGFGAAEKPQEVDRYRGTRIVADVLDVLPEEPVHVVGHDWGAGMAWVLAALQPDRVRSLAALSVGHPNVRPTIEQRRLSWYMLFFQFEEAEELLLRDDAALMREWIAGSPDAERQVAALREPGALTAGLNWYRANLHPRGELRGRPLPPVSARTLGIWSTGDPYLGEEQMTRSAEHVTGPWRYERVEGASHWLQLDAPDEVTRLLLEHLRS